jgi:hypothetical protein
MKNQINTLNITGAAVSASLMVFLYFLPSLNLLSLIKRRSINKTEKTQVQQLPKLRRYKKPLPPASMDTCSSPSIETQKEEVESINQPESTEQTPLPETQEPIASPSALVDTCSSPSIETQNEETEPINQPESTEQTTMPETQEPIAPQEITEIEPQEQDLECTKLEDTPQQLPSKSNGCPKNLDYYTMKPRPKKTPEECITCKNLIDCVCLTSS